MFFFSNLPNIEVSELKDEVKTRAFICSLLDNNPLEIDIPFVIKLFNTGIIPEYPVADNYDHLSTLKAWFIERMTFDICCLSTAAEEHFERFLDLIDFKSTQALFELGSIAAKYDLYPADYNENGIKRITDAAERTLFQKHYVNEAVLDSAFQILAYTFYIIHGKLYAVKT